MFQPVATPSQIQRSGNESEDADDKGKLRGPAVIIAPGDQRSLVIMSRDEITFFLML